MPAHRSGKAPAALGGTKPFLGQFDGRTMQKVLRGCVSSESPKGLLADGTIERVRFGVWACAVRCLGTGEDRGRRYLSRTAYSFKVSKEEPGA